jgi:hypothetical protein
VDGAGRSATPSRRSQGPRDDVRPQPYATRWAAERHGWVTGGEADRKRVRRALRALEQRGWLEFRGELKRLKGVPHGTKCFALTEKAWRETPASDEVVVQAFVSAFDAEKIKCDS